MIIFQGTRKRIIGKKQRRTWVNFKKGGRAKIIVKKCVIYADIRAVHVVVDHSY